MPIAENLGNVQSILKQMAKMSNNNSMLQVVSTQEPRQHRLGDVVLQLGTICIARLMYTAAQDAQLVLCRVDIIGLDEKHAKLSHDDRVISSKHAIFQKYASAANEAMHFYCNTAKYKDFAFQAMLQYLTSFARCFGDACAICGTMLQENEPICMTTFASCTPLHRICLQSSPIVKFQ